MSTADTRIAQLKKVISDEALSSSENEHRLAHAIDAEYAKPDMDAAFIQACEDLLWQIRAGEQPFVSANQQYAAAMRKHMKAERKHAIPVFVRRFAIVCAAMLILVAVLEGISRQEWITWEMTPDNEQLVVTGHRIDTNVISKSIARHEYNDYVSSDNYQDLVDFLGFEPIRPSAEELGMVEYWYNAFVSPFDIMMVISYQYPLAVPEQTDGDMTGALYTVSYVTDTGEASMSYESSSSQNAVDIHGVEVLCGKNEDWDTYTWVQHNNIYHLTGTMAHDVAMAEVERLILASQ